MICISGCGHLYLPEMLGMIVLPSSVDQRVSSYMAGSGFRVLHSRRGSLPNGKDRLTIRGTQEPHNLPQSSPLREDPLSGVEERY